MINDYIHKDDLPLFTSGSRFSLASIFLKEGMQDTYATFDLFIRELPSTRNYFIFCGLEHVVDYLKNLKFNTTQLKWLRRHFKFSVKEMTYFKNFKFTGDIWALPEGSFFFPNEPIIRVTAPIIEAQLIEMFLINAVYLQTALASKLARFIIAANGKQITLGFNRTYGTDAAVKATRISKIFGAQTSLAVYNFLQREKQPYSVSTFHYFIMSFEKELAAFRTYLRHARGHGFLLVDTYNSLSGIKNFIKAAKEMEKRGVKATGIQLDSGDLYKLSVMARAMLDRAGLLYVKIFVMSNLDEWKVAALEKKGAPIDIYAGVTELLTPSDAPTLELVYKLSEIRQGTTILPKIKTSTRKVSLPGRKQIFRKMKNGKYVGDVIGREGESRQGRKILKPIILKGRVVYKFPTLKAIGRYFYKERERFKSTIFDINKKYYYPVLISNRLQKLVNKIRAEMKVNSVTDLSD